MEIIRRIFDKKAVPLLAAAALLLFVAESRRQLRKRTQPRVKRLTTNTIVALPSFSLLRYLLLPVMVNMAKESRKRKAGLFYQVNAALALKHVAAFLLLDYSNYIWHILLHRIPLLWRFHLVHHSDLDLDLTTAFRFHFGELIGSVASRGFAVFAIGPSPLLVLLYEAIFEGATQFHHTNWRLPFKVENALNKVIVTPRMHGIHHSMVKQETDSNYAVIFSFWDRLHRTIRLNIPQDLVVIGVPSYSNARELTTGYLLKLPFTKVRPWQAPGDADTARGTPDGPSALAK